MNINRTLDIFVYDEESAQILYDVVSASSAFVNAPDGGFVKLAILGATVGFILMVLRAIGTQKLDFNFLIYGIIAYVTMFGTTIKMEIKLIGTNLGYQIMHDVPLGIALPSHIVTSITQKGQVKISEYFTSTSNYPSVPGETGQIVAKLGTVLKYRDKVAEATNLTGNSDQAGKGNLTSTLKEYLVTCIISDPEKDLSQITKSNNPLNEIRSDWGAVLTTVYLPGMSEPEVKDCIEAGQLISDNLANSPDLLDDALRQASVKTGITNRQFVIDTRQYLDDLFSSYTNSQSVLLNIYLYETTEAAREEFFHATQPALSKMIADAREKRLMKSVVDEQLYQDVIWKTASYLQAFVFAFFPFMIFIIMMGAAGLKAVMSYVLVLLWVALWGTGSVIVEFITDLGMRQAYDAYVVGNFDLKSIANDQLFNSPMGTVQLYVEMGRWYSTGADMMTAVPIITLAMITGSIFSLSSVANKLSTSENDIDTSETVPNKGKSEFGSSGYSVAKMGANNAGYYMAHRFTGGANEQDPQTFSFNEAEANQLSKNASIAEDRAKTTTSAYTTSMSELVSENEAYVKGQVSEEALQTASGQRQQKAIDITNQVGKENDFSNEDRAVLGLQAALGLSSKQAIRGIQGAKDINRNKKGAEARRVASDQLIKNLGLKGTAAKVVSGIAQKGAGFLNTMLETANMNAGLGLSKDQISSSSEKVNSTLSESEKYSDEQSSDLQESLGFRDSETGQDTSLYQKSASTVDSYNESIAATERATDARETANIMTNVASNSMSINKENLLNGFINPLNKNLPINKKLLASVASQFIRNKADLESFLADPRALRNRPILNNLASSVGAIGAFKLAKSVGLIPDVVPEQEDYYDDMKDNNQQYQETMGLNPDSSVIDDVSSMKSDTLQNIADGRQRLTPQAQKELIQSQYLSNRERAIMADLNIPESIQAQFAAQNALNVQNQQKNYDDTYGSKFGALGNYLLGNLGELSTNIGGSAILASDAGSGLSQAFDGGRQRMAALMATMDSNQMQSSFNQLGLGDASAVQKLQNGQSLNTDELQLVANQIAQLQEMDSQSFGSNSGLAPTQFNPNSDAQSAAFSTLSNGVNRAAAVEAYTSFLSSDNLGKNTGSFVADMTNAGKQTINAAGNAVKDSSIAMGTAITSLASGDFDGAKQAYIDLNNAVNDGFDAVNPVPDFIVDFMDSFADGFENRARELGSNQTLSDVETQLPVDPVPIVNDAPQNYQTPSNDPVPSPNFGNLQYPNIPN